MAAKRIRRRRWQTDRDRIVEHTRRSFRRKVLLLHLAFLLDVDQQVTIDERANVGFVRITASFARLDVFFFNQRESRQLGMIDMQGRSAAHTGKSNSVWAGSKQGKNYTTQANIMVGPEVLDAVSATFEKTEGTGMPLAERMILALEAGYATGGDKRWATCSRQRSRSPIPTIPAAATITSRWRSRSAKTSTRSPR